MDAGAGPALALHDARSRSAAPRRSSPTPSPRRSTARTRSTSRSTSTSSIRAWRPGTGTPEPGGMLTREVLRAIRQIVGAVDLAGMDIVEVVAAVRPGRDDGDGREPRARSRRSARWPCGARPAAACAGRAARPRLDDRRDRGRAGTAVRPGPGRGPGRPRPLPRPGRADRRPGPRAGRRQRPPGRPACGRPAAGSRPSTSTRPCSTGLGRSRRREGVGDGRADAGRGRPRSISACPTPGRFGLAFIALNSLMILASRDAQRRRFGRSRDHLAPGGVAAVDVWMPDADDLARFDGRVILEWPRTRSRDRAPRHEGRLGDPRCGDRHGRR